MPRPRNTEDRQLQIILGLEAVMAKHGYRGASIQAIAKAANLSPGLVHYHFGSKQQILLALVDHLIQAVSDRLSKRLASSTSPWERLDAFIDAHLGLEDADSTAVACWVAIASEALTQAEVRAVYQRAVRAALDMLRALVEAVLSVESCPDTHTEAITAGLYSAIQGAFQLAIVAEATPVGFAARATKHMARGLIAAEKVP